MMPSSHRDQIYKDESDEEPDEIHSGELKSIKKRKR
jgi:hypothetical protein